MKFGEISLPGPTSTIIPQCSDSLDNLTYSAPASAAWATTNRAYFVPFRLYIPWIAKLMFVANGTTVAGTNHADIGIYSVDGTRIVSTGSTIVTGTSVIQTYDIADTQLPPGSYYMALVMDNASDHTLRRTPAAPDDRLAGIMQMASAFPLPSVATFSNAATLFPLFGVTDDTVV